MTIEEIQGELLTKACDTMEGFNRTVTHLEHRITKLTQHLDEIEVKVKEHKKILRLEDIIRELQKSRTYINKRITLFDKKFKELS